MCDLIRMPFVIAAFLILIDANHHASEAQTLKFDLNGKPMMVDKGSRGTPASNMALGAFSRWTGGTHDKTESQQDLTDQRTTAAQSATSYRPAVPEGEVARTRSRWSTQDIRKAQAICRQIFKTVDAEVTPGDPIKNGRCGEAAPVKLHSITGRTEVVFEPAPTLNCPMVAALAKWINADLQPLAKRYLRARIREVSVMSDYSCRNVYGRKNGNLSQHARANALDIRGFVTADNRRTYLLHHWGPTRRAINRYIASKKKQRQKQRRRAKASAASSNAAQRTQSGQHAKPPAPAQASPDKIQTAAGNTTSAGDATPAKEANGQDEIQPKQSASRPVIVRGTVAPGSAQALDRFAIGFGLMSRLGGPKSKKTRRPREKINTKPLFKTVDRSRRLFLRKAQKAACGRFGTVLGPEANYAHRHHFHVDLANRDYGSYCR